MLEKLQDAARLYVGDSDELWFFQRWWRQLHFFFFASETVQQCIEDILSAKDDAMEHLTAKIKTMKQLVAEQDSLFYQLFSFVFNDAKSQQSQKTAGSDSQTVELSEDHPPACDGKSHVIIEHVGEHSNRRLHEEIMEMTAECLALDPTNSDKMREMRQKIDHFIVNIPLSGCDDVLRAYEELENTWRDHRVSPLLSQLYDLEGGDNILENDRKLTFARMLLDAALGEDHNALSDDPLVSTLQADQQLKIRFALHVIKRTFVDNKMQRYINLSVLTKASDTVSGHEAKVAMSYLTRLLRLARKYDTRLHEMMREPCMSKTCSKSVNKLRSAIDTQCDLMGIHC